MGKRLGAVMASVVLVLFAVAFGVFLGGCLTVSLAIRQDDRARAVGRKSDFSVLSLLIVFLFGINFGVAGGAVCGSRFGVLLAPNGRSLQCWAGAFYGVYTRDDDGYLRSLLQRENQPSDDPRGDYQPDWSGQETDR